MILKDKSREEFHYVLLKKQFDNFGCEDIINEFGQSIGKIVISFFNPYKNIKIQCLNTEKIIVIEKKKRFLYVIQDMKNKDNKLIARIKKNKFPFHISKMYFKDDNDNKQFTAVGNFKHWNFVIMDNYDKELIAKVESFNEKNSKFQDLHLRSNNYYYIEFLNPNIDKLIIICFIITINNLIHKFRGISDITGFVRKIARLRPFGPGRSLN